jgi:hypothetical protein
MHRGFGGKRGGSCEVVDGLGTQGRSPNKLLLGKRCPFFAHTTGVASTLKLVDQALTGICGAAGGRCGALSSERARYSRRRWHSLGLCCLRNSSAREFPDLLLRLCYGQPRHAESRGPSGWGARAKPGLAQQERPFLGTVAASPVICVVQN